MTIDPKTAAARIRTVIRPWQEVLAGGGGLSAEQVIHGLDRLADVANELDPAQGVCHGVCRGERPTTLKPGHGRPALHLVDCTGGPDGGDVA